MKREEIPTRENCDLDDPEEMFLWMFVSLPELKGALAILPFEYYRLVSKRMYELGARLGADPTLKLRLPQSEEAWLTGAGTWVPIDEPDPPVSEAKDLVRALPPHLRKELDDALDEIKAEESAHQNQED
ncbi:uncharacterized protein DUF2744 [Rhodococcus sp. AG1013]|uniref:phage gene 29 protein family protein n=1 Tax=Rhodococcus sp. AG1013 TaxID=2183996 RepID=UPI000E2B8436|nr:DUF2744 domain-containing protein [Rhodococcus sp. AG1013]RDI13442.1 uncharacterized protein DUF2744 [Rhodococcus sp. AG1013]